MIFRDKVNSHGRLRTIFQEELNPHGCSRTPNCSFNLRGNSRMLEQFMFILLVLFHPGLSRILAEVVHGY